MQGLVGAANLGWGLLASPYTVHGGDEVLWTVRGVGEEVNGMEVAGTILKNLEAVWGVGSLVGCWVENKMSAHVVVRGIPEGEWFSEQGGVQGLVVGNLDIMWGLRQPVVVSRAWNRVDVVAALGMSPLVSSFYLVIYTRVLCSSWEDICLAMRTDRMLAAAKV